MQDFEAMAQRSFDRQLDDYLERTSKEPFRAFDYCGGNLFDFDDYYDIGGDKVCERCCQRKSTDELEASEWR